MDNLPTYKIIDYNPFTVEYSLNGFVKTVVYEEPLSNREIKKQLFYVVFDSPGDNHREYDDTDEFFAKD